MSDVVRAAGGVVARAVPDGVLELLIVHRPRYDDWTLPKGKAEPGESDEECALREVEEETSLVCTLGDEVAVTRYEDARGCPKRVRYFEMKPLGEASARNEVDAVQWVTREALETLTYRRDAEIAKRVLRS